ncbi:MAG: protoporphyrinogen oxidase [Sodalis sp. Psp]|nr:protoporphyrinogen oxidase [Sodalis sp. Psp]MCR3756887.1 protoporphyrinogen oxidase [Sodalis sp. Ppy]
MKTLILYSSHDGQTYKIARTIATHLTYYCECDVVDLRLTRDYKGLKKYQRIVLGAAIRYNHFGTEVDRFITQQLDWLHSIPSAFYSVNLTARKPEKRTPETNTYTRKFLAKTPWRPDLCTVFAGALCYPRYCRLDQMMIQLIMRITGGETDLTKEVEYTDWQQVSTFANNLAQLTTKRTVQRAY